MATIKELKAQQKIYDDYFTNVLKIKNWRNAKLINHFETIDHG